MIDFTEVRLARQLGVAIEEELAKGTILPEDIKRAYLELYNYWQYQMSRELS